jgi:EAL domain-containing protein (putative c-di-GMP-specific phosphodiesterase class I)
MLLLLRWAQADAESVVLEITEREAVRDLGRFEEVLGAYREHGFRFALDDVGEGHSTFELLASAAPEFVKISSRLVTRRSAAAQQSAIRGIVAFAAASGATVIAEGIESEEDARVMAGLGVVLGQGWALGRPEAPELLPQRPLLQVVETPSVVLPSAQLLRPTADGPALISS